MSLAHGVARISLPGLLRRSPRDVYVLGQADACQKTRPTRFCTHSDGVVAASGRQHVRGLSSPCDGLDSLVTELQGGAAAVLSRAWRLLPAHHACSQVRGWAAQRGCCVQHLLHTGS